MIKRPLDSRFASAVLEGRKLTTLGVAIPPAAVVLRPWRFGKDDEPIHFTGSIFKRGVVGVSLYLRRMEAFGYLVGTDLHAADYAVDLMDEEGSILETFAITKEGFEWCRRKLNAVKDA